MKKRSKLLAAALAMLTFSTAASITGTVAWFTASNMVNVSGMSIQAQTEEGIVISNEEQTVWKTSAVASHNTAVSVIPTSTADAVTWYHNTSNDEDVSTGTGVVGTYAAYTGATEDLATEPAKIKVVSGVGTVDYDQSATTADDAKNIFLLNKFYIKSSTNTALTKPLYINSVAIDNHTTDLHKAVRILVKYSTYVNIYGIDGRTASYGVNGAASGVTTITEADPVNTLIANGVSIPANDTASPLEISVYAYFEGEDANCTSSNANATNALNALSVSLAFGTTLKA